MKSIIFHTTFCFAALSNLSVAQVEFPCGTVAPQGEVIVAAETHGIYLPAQNDLKILVVFARFKDDTSYHNEWPVDSDPTGYTTWIDPTIQTGSTNLENFTHYFNEMSLGAWRVTGTAVSVETPQNRSYYGTNYYLANKEVLLQKVDPLVNFADFDNWRFDSPYHHTNTSDNVVDMIVMMWRTKPFAGNWGGEASLGRSTEYTVEGGTKTIKTFFGGNSGSGVTVYYRGDVFRKYNFHSAIHEVSHWLLGGAHPYSGEPQHALWGMLGTSNAWGIAANSYEREQLGWIQVEEAVEWSSLSDFITTGVAYKFHPPGGDANEYYYFENHQKLSIYDDAVDNPNDKGILVLHQRDIYNSSHNIRVRSQDGFWSWNHTSNNTICFPGYSVPVFRKVSVNRSTGLSHRDKLPKSPSGVDWMIAYVNQAGTEFCGGFPSGAAPFYGTFNTTVNNIFSTWSNPPAATWTGSTFNFGMQVLEQNGSTVNVWFYTQDDAISAPPSKPQNVRFIGTLYNPIEVAWDANLESDISYYEVWRRDLSEPAAWSLIGTTSSTQYTDNAFIWLPSGNADLEYKVRVKDTQAMFSLFSEASFVEGEPMEKAGGEEKLEFVGGSPKDFEIHQNFPNPFNPETKIGFAMPEPGFVEIIITDLLGRKILTLIQRHFPTGHHSVTWKGEVASGTYLCRVSVKAIGGAVYDKTIRMVLQR